VNYEIFNFSLHQRRLLFLPRWKTEIRAAAPGVVLFEIQKGKMIIKVCNRGGEKRGLTPRA
jgi:hypothetical protein